MARTKRNTRRLTLVASIGDQIFGTGIGPMTDHATTKKTTGHNWPKKTQHKGWVEGLSKGRNDSSLILRELLFLPLAGLHPLDTDHLIRNCSRS